MRLKDFLDPFHYLACALKQYPSGSPERYEAMHEAALRFVALVPEAKRRDLVIFASYVEAAGRCSEVADLLYDASEADQGSLTLTQRHTASAVSGGTHGHTDHSPNSSQHTAGNSPEPEKL